MHHTHGDETIIYMFVQKPAKQHTLILQKRQKNSHELGAQFREPVLIHVVVCA